MNFLHNVTLEEANTAYLVVTGHVEGYAYVRSKYVSTRCLLTVRVTNAGFVPQELLIDWQAYLGLKIIDFSQASRIEAESQTKIFIGDDVVPIASFSFASGPRFWHPFRGMF